MTMPPSQDWVTTTQVLDELRGAEHSAAWQRLHESFHHVIVAFARRRGLGAADAEDAAQETMLALFRAFREGRYDRSRGRLSHWLFGVARNTVANIRRRRGREPAVPSAESGTNFWDRLPDDGADEHAWTIEWQQMVLQKCLQRARGEFSRQTFEAFERYALANEPAAAVAAALEMTPNAVYIAKNRVLTRLRELEREFEGDRLT